MSYHAMHKGKVRPTCGTDWPLWVDFCKCGTDIWTGKTREEYTLVQLKDANEQKARADRLEALLREVREGLFDIVDGGELGDRIDAEIGEAP